MDGPSTNPSVQPQVQADEDPDFQGRPQAQGQGEAAPAPATAYLPKLQEAGHPTACAFHLAFKVAGLACYLFMGLFGSDETFKYIIVISLAALDFWTVKNVTGRLLVGLRWWSRVDGRGEEEWFFEKHPTKEKNKTDTRLFWGAQYLFCVLWPLFAVFSILTLHISDFTVCLVGAALTCANTLGYVKCDRNH